MTSAAERLRASSRTASLRGAQVGRAVAVSCGALGGFGIGLLVIREDLVAAVAAVAGAAALFAALAAVDARARAAVGAIIGLAYSARLALMALLHEVLIAIGRGGHLFGDDWTYEWIAWQLAQYWRGASEPIQWFGNAYLMGTFVYLESAAFFVFGPEVTIVKVLNCALGAGTALLLYLIADRIWDRRAGYVAAGLAAFFPSLFLWSILNLKDALALFLIAAVVWLAIRHAIAPSGWRWLIFVLLSFVLLESLRRYLFWMLAVLVPLVILIASRPRTKERAIAAGLTLVAGLILWTASSNGILGPIWFSDPHVRNAFVEAGLVPASAKLPTTPLTLETLDRMRAYAAADARTAFTEADRSGSLSVKDGDRFFVRPATPAATPGAAPESRIVRAKPGDRLVLEQPTATAPPGTIAVRPGDTVIVGAENEVTMPKPLVLPPTADRPVELVAAGTLESNVRSAASLAAHLPKGFAYALAAPFPWAAATTADRLTVPDMLLWYPIVVAAGIGAWRYRSRWRELAVVYVLGGGILIVLAVAEGNVGTLFRHRAMLLPFAILFAAPGLAAWAQRFVRSELPDH